MKLLHSTNPLNPADATAFEARDGSTPNQAIAECGLSFARPVVLVVNGEAWGRAQWDDPFPAGALVMFVEIPGALAVAIIAVVLSIGSLVYAMSMSPGSAGDRGTPSSIYSFSTGRNRLRIGEPFAESFGRQRIFPDLAQQCYVQNIDNDQYLYFLGILGVGRYDVEGVFIEKTPLTDYADSSYQVVAPGGSPALIPNVVWTCNEASNQELKTDWISYVVSAVDTEAYFLEYDLTFPAGLVRYNKEGKARSKSVTIQTEARTVDASGTGTSAWTTLETQTFTARSKDPLRYSRKIAAPLGPGRYEFRVCRTTEASTSSSAMDKVALSGLRAHGGPHPDYGDVTLIEAKIKASDQLSGDAASQINVICTRKLYPVTASGFGTTLTASRSIADVCAYMVTADNGGRQADAIVDFAALYDLRGDWEAAGHYFDYRFTSVQSVMDAVAMATTCGRAVPYMPGGLFSVVRDELQALPTCVFTRDNIADLTITTSPRTPDSPTCVNVTYTNPGTWDEEDVVCLALGGSEDNPSEITLDGCASRQQAYEIGMFLYWQDRLERTAVEFTTGLIGHIPNLLSKILVPNTLIDWGQDGLIMAVEPGLIWLSEPVDFGGASEGALYISLPDGGSGGPYTVTPTDYAHCVVGTIPALLPLSDHDLKATRYLFGPAEQAPMFVRVNKVQPQGRDKIKISGRVINDDVYADPGTAPAVGSSVGTPPLLSGLSLSHTGESGSDHAFVVSWTGSAAKVKIELNEGGGYATLEDNYTSHSKAFTTTASTITVKITPYNGSGVLQTGSAQTDDHAFLAAPTGLAVVTSDVGISVSWSAYSGATSYDVAIEVGGEEVLGTDAEGTSTSVTMQELELSGGPWDSFTVYLSANTASGPTARASLAVNVAALAAPATVDFQARLANGVSLSWDEVANAAEYVVCYGGSSSGFTPTQSNVVYRGSQPAATIGGLAMTGSYAHHFKVAALTGHGEAFGDLNFSGALTVTPATADVSVHTVTGSGTFTGPAGGSSYTYQLTGTATATAATVTASLTGGGSGSAWCSGDGGGNPTSASLTATSSGSGNSCTVTISGGSFSGTLMITKIS
ncbi:host specificity factor TipJ family phage tail protein [Desulfuromonas thiophila]|uniref:Tip attachment protein J HDII-ins2 domain-containing protein n=1 Tax=Desulfuromonas thiophila TaxID=57664 RepID=A0A1G7B191_9BACT|nr:host specificity factor TipJ family phage tail protein [Desulfuromonas thiophila]SDE20700.1 hypothetical protein SAMN05661003_1058 [Desulfuromonas thiophila]